MKRTDGCVLCALLSQLEYHHLVRFGCAALETEEFKRDFYAGLGLCNWHFWELRRCFWGPGLAQTLLDVLEMMPANLGLADSDSPLRLLDKSACWLCRELSQDEADFVAHMSRFAEDGAFREVYAQSRGLCLPHIAPVAAAACSEARRWLLNIELEHWHSLKQDLAEFVRKHNPALPAQKTPNVESGPTRCIQKLVGNIGALGRRRIRDE